MTMVIKMIKMILMLKNMMFRIIIIAQIRQTRKKRKSMSHPKNLIREHLKIKKKVNLQKALKL